MRWRSCFMLLAIDALLWACSYNPPYPKAAGFIPPTTQPSLILESYDPAFDDDSMMEWGTEALERFGPKVVIVGCHGWYAVNGDWLVFPVTLNSPDSHDRPWPVEHLIAHEKAAHPGYKIILLCCNSDHVVLHGFPDIWYSPDDNFIIPTRFTSAAEQLKRRFGYPTIVGDISGFQEAK